MRSTMVELADRVEIRAVIEGYFAGIDRGDKDQLARCFARHAVYQSLGGTLDMCGREEIREKLVSGTLAASHHVPAHVTIEMDGNGGARTETLAIAYLVKHPNPGGQILVRGLRYEDQLVREDGIWVIAKRKHITLWQTETTSVAPFLP